METCFKPSDFPSAQHKQGYRMTYASVIIGSDDELLLVRGQATNFISAGLLLIGPLETYYSRILIIMQQIFLRRTHLKM